MKNTGASLASCMMYLSDRASHARTLRFRARFVRTATRSLRFRTDPKPREVRTVPRDAQDVADESSEPTEEDFHEQPEEGRASSLSRLAVIVG